MCSRYRSAKDEGYVVGIDLLRMFSRYRSAKDEGCVVGMDMLRIKDV